MAYVRKEISIEKIREQEKICAEINEKLGEKPRLAMVDT